MVSIPRRSITPAHYFAKMTYTDVFTYVPLAGLYESRRFRGNSVYDPDYTGGGGQPTGFDQLAALYQRYTVYAAKTKCQLMNGPTNQTTVASFAALSLLADTSGSSVGNYTVIDKLPHSNSYIPSGPILSGSRTPRTVSMYTTTASMFGIDKDTVTNKANYSADVGSNPVNQWFQHVTVSNLDGGTQANVAVYTKITYYVRFEQPATMLES